MSYATNEDLTFYMPDALEHGIADWSAELNLATGDIQRELKVRWFIPEYGSSKNYRSAVFIPEYDPTLLQASQWTRATVYKAMYQYILPKLSTFRPEGDAFRERIDFYRKSYAEEMNLQMSAGVEYDFNKDGMIETGERWATMQDRMYR